MTLCRWPASYQIKKLPPLPVQYISSRPASLIFHPYCLNPADLLASQTMKLLLLVWGLHTHTHTKRNIFSNVPCRLRLALSSQLHPYSLELSLCQRAAEGYASQRLLLTTQAARLMQGGRASDGLTAKSQAVAAGQQADAALVDAAGLAAIIADIQRQHADAGERWAMVGRRGSLVSCCPSAGQTRQLFINSQWLPLLSESMHTWLYAQ